MKNKLTFNEVAALWEKDKRAYVKRSTFSIYSLHLRRHLIPAFGPQTGVSESEVQSFVNNRLQEGMRPKTVKDILMVLQMVLRYAAKYCCWEYPSMDIRYPTSRLSPHLHVLTLHQQRKLLQYLNKHFSYYNLGIAICLQTGLRIGEICALTWADLDLKAGLLHVCKTLQRIYLGPHCTEVILDTPKTTHSYREIPLSPQLIKQLRPLKRQAEPGHFVLTGSAKPAEPGNLRAYYKRLMRSLGLPSIHFHGLRHSFATRCIECGCDYKTVSALLGHANISTTLNLYVHPDLSLKKRCVNKASRQLQ
jgi:integrase